MSKQRKAIVIAVCGLGLLIGGLAPIIFSIASGWRYETVEAKVISSSLGMKTETLPNGEFSSWRYPRIVYTFTYKNKVYRVERYERPEKKYTAALSRTIVDRYPLGKTITVYFPPGKPTEAIMKLESASTLAYVLPLGGAVLLIAGIRKVCKARSAKPSVDS